MLSVWAWAEKRRRLGKNVTAKPGRYRIEATPYQKEPQEAFTHPEVQTTVLYWAKRLGKTEMLNNLHGSVIEQDPKNILVVYPILGSAKKWSRQFFTPMVKSTPVLRARMKETGRREADNTILSKDFPGGNISAIGAESPSGFRQVQAPVVTCDEIDTMENGTEGDPITLAFGRAENYPDSIQVVSSTATRINQAQGDATKGSSGSRIHDWWLKSDQRKWFVLCGCGKSHVLAWANVKWPDGEPAKAYYEAPCCGAKWDDYARVKAICNGEWRATAKFDGIAGFWLNGLNTTFPPKKGYKTKLHQMAAEFLDAYKGGEATTIAWKNTFLCEPHEDVTEKIDVEEVLKRAENYNPQAIPEPVIFLSAAVDVQADRLEIEVCGLGLNDETWGIEKKVIYGHTASPDVWHELTEFLTQKYKREDGVILEIEATACDMRHNGPAVRSWIRNCGLPRVFPVYGVADRQPFLVSPRMNKHYRMRTFAVAGDNAKDTIFARLRIEKPGPRFMHFPIGSGYDKDYFDQLTAEVLKTKYIKGFPIKYYEKLRERNEALDLRVYWLAVIDIIKPHLTLIAKRLKPNVEPVKATDYVLKPEPPPAPPATKPKPPPIRQQFRPRGWVGGWR